MKKFHTATAGLLLAVSAAAQGVTSPAGYLSTEGRGWEGISLPGYAYLFGSSPTLHAQWMDGEMKGLGSRTIKSVGFRLDGRTYSSVDAVGRSWSNITLQLADGELAAMGSNFAQNAASTPTTVFSGSVAWPTITGGPGSAQNNWTNAHQFNFQSNFLYSGNKDLLLDWQFLGGTMANNATWNSTNLYNYLLDGVQLKLASSSGYSVYRTNGYCADSAITQTNASSNAAGAITLWSPAYDSFPTWADKVTFQNYTHYTAPSAPVIQAISLYGSSPGVSIGAKCNNLMLDMSKPKILFYGNANIYGHYSSPLTVLGDRSTFASLGQSVTIWSQAAWADSAAGQFALTAATRSTPDFNATLNTTTPKRKLVYAFNEVSTVGTKPSVSQWYFLPITRYQ